MSNRETTIFRTDSLALPDETSRPVSHSPSRPTSESQPMYRPYDADERLTVYFSVLPMGI